MTRSFADRRSAGRELARALLRHELAADTLVLGLPRGGVPVAYEVARALHAALDVLIVRKIGAPDQPELAIGALASGGIVVREPHSSLAGDVSHETFEQLQQHERVELERRTQAYRQGRAPLRLHHRPIILVDDGLATGTTMLAAVRAVRAAGATTVTVAAPVASTEAMALLRGEADAVVVLQAPPQFLAVGQWYQRFEQTTDEEVNALLAAAGNGAREPSVAARLNADSFPHPVARLQRRETPISSLLLTGSYAYKIKKPVRLAFIDASTLALREHLCREELRLNRRFAPDLYLDVLPISEHPEGLRVGAAGTAVDYAVRMQQFDPSQELAALLASGDLSSGELAAFGTRLADWHAAAPAASASDPYGSVELIREQVRANFGTVRARLVGEDAARLPHLEQWTEQELQRLQPLLRERRASGQVRECHGDLHAGNILRWHDGLVPFDCLEFEPRLRWIDVMSDVAFLFMDLSSHAREDLAYAFLSAYLERGGDYRGLRLLAFYAVYRALVRAKVDALTVTAEACSRLHQRLLIAERLTRTRTSTLVLMHGVTGSGKSFLSTQLITRLGAVRARSDLERQRLFGPGAYSPEATAATYERLYACAESALQGGQRIIVDATFLSRQRRIPFERLARAHDCPLWIVSCRAPTALLRERVAGRSRAGNDPSEATPAVLERQMHQQDTWVSDERTHLIEVDTAADDAVEQALASIRSRTAAPPSPPSLPRA